MIWRCFEITLYVQKYFAKLFPRPLTTKLFFLVQFRTHFTYQCAILSFILEVTSLKNTSDTSDTFVLFRNCSLRLAFSPLAAKITYRLRSHAWICWSFLNTKMKRHCEKNSSTPSPQAPVSNFRKKKFITPVGATTSFINLISLLSFVNGRTVMLENKLFSQHHVNFRSNLKSVWLFGSLIDNDNT